MSEADLEPIPEPEPAPGQLAIDAELAALRPRVPVNVALEEALRRRDAAKAQKEARAKNTGYGDDTLLPPDVARAARDAFLATHTGYWLVHFCNAAFTTQYEKPGVRLLSFHGTYPEAAQRARLIMNDKEHPEAACYNISIVPANDPTIIPFSEAANRDAAHVLAKVKRLQLRYQERWNAIQKEFEDRLQGAPAVIKDSPYHEQKTYLANRPLPTGAAVPVSQPLVPVAPKLEDLIDVVPASVDFSAEAPGPLMQVVAQGTVAPGSTTAEWPTSLQTSSRFAVLAWLPDVDSVEDTPDRPECAGREPLVLLFGGGYPDEDTAQTAMDRDIGPWCPEIKLWRVDMYGWLFPTEVDPDAVPRKVRTRFTGDQEELQRIAVARDENNSTSAKLLQGKLGNRYGVSYLGGAANPQELPDLEDVDKLALLPAGVGQAGGTGAMCIIGKEDLDAEGNVLSAAGADLKPTTWALPVATTDLPEL